MSSLNKNNEDVWFVIDARIAKNGVSSGISRFIIGLTRALVKQLSFRKQNPNDPVSRLKILIISKSEPGDWINYLVYKYPSVVSFWKSDNHGLFRNKADKLSWLWPTLVIKKLQLMTSNKLIWFAPANFDRPLFISNKNLVHRVIQVVHDAIPFLKTKGFGFFFRRQFKLLVSRTVSKLPYIATVSQFSADSLNSVVKKRAGNMYIISDAVDEEFGAKPKLYLKNDLITGRSKFLKEFDADNESLNVLKGHWVVGVGRNQKYKCWDIALQAIEKLNNSDSQKKIWFVRVGADTKEVMSYMKKYSAKEYGKIKLFDELNLIILPFVSDEQLSQLYTLSDLLVHPSLAEGFGLPPLEAALSGLPVVFRKGTAVDEHFAEGNLPNNFWHSIDSQYSAVWANQIERILMDKKDSPFYCGLYSSKSPRNYIIDYSKSSRSFQWSDSATALLNLVGGQGGVLDNLKNSNV